MALVAVTGGAGYIGANICKVLTEKGYEVRVIDDFSSGLESRLSGVKLEIARGNILDRAFLEQALQGVHSVIHLAAKKSVEESVQFPMKYYENNIVGSLNLIAAMLSHGIKKIIFSSTAVVYSSTQGRPLSEDDPKEALSPYAHSKLLFEELLAELGEAEEVSSVSLRYFNVVGAGGSFLGDNARDNLVPKVFAALTSGSSPEIYGTDYPTHDGTCIRDYVHVTDLAEAHIRALEFAESRRVSETFNVGSGRGYSVKEVLDQIKKSTGFNFEARESERRSGDPVQLLADISKIARLLDWRPRSTLQEMIDSAWEADQAMRS